MKGDWVIPLADTEASFCPQEIKQIKKQQNKGLK